jgi:membrane protein
MTWSVSRFFDNQVWEIRVKDLPRLKALALRVLRISVLAARRFVVDRCQKTASVLTYYSLLNVVPVLAVAFAVAKGFGLEKLIEKQVLQIAEKTNLQPDVTHQILSFSHNLLVKAKGGLIAGIGIILLFWTVISILGKIEESLNDIWEVKKARTLMRKFSDYIAIIVFGPILLVISGSATILVASKVEVVLSKITLLGTFSHAILYLLNLLPYVSIWVLFTMVYLMMPNIRIPPRAAITGGVVAGTIAQIVQWVYIKFQIGVADYGAIYGSFAALPLFLVWIQMTWMIVLFGAEIAYATEHNETYGFHPDYSQLSVSGRRLLMLRVVHLVFKRFALGEKPLTSRQIAEALEIPLRLVQQLLRQLEEAGLVVETRSSGERNPAFQPARSVEGVTLQVAISEYERTGKTGIPAYRPDEAERVLQKLKAISDAAEKSAANVRVTDV